MTVSPPNALAPISLRDPIKAILHQRLQQRLQKQAESNESPSRSTLMASTSTAHQYPFANFQSQQHFGDFPEPLQMALPPEFSYILGSYEPIVREPISIPGAPIHFFEASVHVRLTTIEQAQQWLALFERRTGAVMRVSQALKTDGKLTLWHRKYHCCHANLAEVKSYPHKKDRGVTAANGRSRLRCTNCLARMSIHLKRVRPLVMGAEGHYPCKIRITMDHNHVMHMSDEPRPYRSALGRCKDSNRFKSTSLHSPNHQPTLNHQQRLSLVELE